MTIDCHYGDHRYGTGAVCEDCGRFNAALLAWGRFEKAEREGRACTDHFHLTTDAKAACRKPVKYADPVEA